VEFACDIPAFTQYTIRCISEVDPIDRILHDFGGTCDQFVHFSHDVDAVPCHVHCIAFLPYLVEASLNNRKCRLNIRLLRYANQVPLITESNVYECAITRAIQYGCDWKRMGYKCIKMPGGNNMMCPLALVPITKEPTSSSVSSSSVSHTTTIPASLASSSSSASSFDLVLAVDVSNMGESTTTFCSLLKNSLDQKYIVAVQSCLSHVIETLARLYPILFMSLEDRREHLIMTEYVPLLATAISRILEKSSMSFDLAHFEAGGLFHGVENMTSLERTLLDRMQYVLSERRPSHHARDIDGASSSSSLS
jgi:hypothetical protein